MTETSPLRCPVDGGPLTARGPGERVCDCEKCLGAWYPGPLAARELGGVSKPDSRSPSSRSHLRCPVDGKELQTAQDGSGVEVNICWRCSGVWLDAGEEARIQGARRARRSLDASVASQANEPTPAAQGGARDPDIDPLTGKRYDPARLAARNRYREKLKNPRWWHVLTPAFWFLVAIPVLAYARGVLTGLIGLSGLSGRIVSSAQDKVSDAVRGLPGHEAEALIEEHEAGFAKPRLNKALGVCEAALAVVGSLIAAPAVTRWVVDALAVDPGFAIALYWFVSWVIALAGFVTLAWVARVHIQDNYVPRLVLDAVVVWLVASAAWSEPPARFSPASARTPALKGTDRLAPRASPQATAFRESQRQRIRAMLESGPDRALLDCYFWAIECGELLGEEPVRLPSGEGLRRRFRFGTMEVTAFYPIGGEPRVEGVVIRGVVRELPYQTVVVGTPRQAALDNLGEPDVVPSENCAGYRSDGTRYSQLTYCFAGGYVNEIRWQARDNLN